MSQRGSRLRRDGRFESRTSPRAVAAAHGGRSVPQTLAEELSAAVANAVRSTAALAHEAHAVRLAAVEPPGSAPGSTDAILAAQAGVRVLARAADELVLRKVALGPKPPRAAAADGGAGGGGVGGGADGAGGGAGGGGAGDGTGGGAHAAALAQLRREKHALRKLAVAWRKRAKGRQHALHTGMAAVAARVADIHLVPPVPVREWRRTGPHTVVSTALGQVQPWLAQTATRQGSDLACVPEPFTTAACSCCGFIPPTPRGAVTSIVCTRCGAVTGRDLPAAPVNILRLALVLGDQADAAAAMRLDTGGSASSSGQP